MPKTRATCAALVLSLSLSLGPGCALKVPPNATPQQVELLRLQELSRVARVVERVGNLLKDIQALEIVAYKRGKVPIESHIAIQTFFEYTADYAHGALERAKDIARPIEDRRAAILEALNWVRDLQAKVVDRIPDEDTRTRLTTYVMAADTILLAWSLMADIDVIPSEFLASLDWIDAQIPLRFAEE